MSTLTWSGLARRLPCTPTRVSGATDALPITGLDRARVLFAEDVLPCDDKVGERVCVVGGGDVGWEVAEHLADNGKKVTVVDILPEIATGMPSALGALMRARLEDKGVLIFTQAAVQEVAPGRVTIRQAGGPTLDFAADVVVIATGRKPRNELSRLL